MYSIQMSSGKMMGITIAGLVLLAGTITVHANPLIHATMDNVDVSDGGNGDTSVASFTVYDTSGNNLHGVASGPLGSTQKVISGQAGAIGESLRLLEASITPGLERHVDFGNVANPVPGNGYTASLWFRQTAPIPTAPALLKKGAMASTDKGFGIELNATAGGFVTLSANPDQDTNENRVAMRLQGVLQTNTWFHVALVLDDDNDVLIGYFNGAGSGTSTVIGGEQELENGWVTAGTVGNGYAPGTSFATDYSLNLGDRWYDTRPIKAPFPGYLDDFAVWDRALNPAEIKSLVSLANEPSLNYNASQASSLWQVYSGSLANVTIDGKDWEYDGDISGDPGSVINLGAAGIGLVLGSDGVGGVVTDSVALIPGDFDGNFEVDGRDFLLWQRDPGIGSLADWQANYGMSLSTISVAVNAVPEPNGLALIVSCNLIVLFCRNRNF